MSASTWSIIFVCVLVSGCVWGMVPTFGLNILTAPAELALTNKIGVWTAPPSSTMAALI